MSSDAEVFLKRDRLTGAYSIEINEYDFERQLAVLRSGQRPPDVEVVIGRRNGYNVDDLSFLDTVGDIGGISLTSEFSDLTCVYRHWELRSLKTEKNRSIDLTGFRQLENLWVSGAVELPGLERATHLKDLYLNGFEFRDRSLRSLERLQRLQLLKLDFPVLESLDGLPGKSLKEFSVWGAYKLAEISGLLEARDTLVRLEVSRCRKIKQLEQVFQLHKLEWLLLFETGSVPSVRAVRELKHLRFFSFAGTDCLDGNVAFMKDIATLKEVRFTNKKHYDAKEWMNDPPLHI